MSHPTVRFRSFWLWATFLAAGAAQYFSSPGLVWLALISLGAYAGESEDAIHESYQDKIAVLEEKLTDATLRADDLEWEKAVLTRHQDDS